MVILQFTTDDVSPPVSDDEEGAKMILEKKISDLEKARNAKKLKRVSI